MGPGLMDPEARGKSEYASPWEIPENFVSWSHFQNLVSFENGFGKTSQTAGFAGKSKVAFSKTEVIKKPLQILLFDSQKFQVYTDKMRIFRKNIT